MSLRVQMVLFQFLLYCVLIIGFDSTQGSNIEPKRLCTVLFHMSTCLGEVFVCSGRGGGACIGVHKNISYCTCLWISGK